MIAKFTLWLLIAFSANSLYGRTVSSRKLSYFQSIANTHHVSPPSFKQGYPVWYGLDDRPRSVIYLKSKVENDLIKIDDSTYVSEPTAEAAAEIFWFSNDSTDLRFFIIPDSRVTYYEFEEFMLGLMGKYPMGTFMLFDDQLQYNQLSYLNFEYSCSPPCIYLRDVLAIRMNSKQLIMMEREVINPESIDSLIEYHFMANLNGETDVSAPNYYFMTKEKLESQIVQYEKLVEDNPADAYWGEKLTELMDKLSMVNRYGPFVELSKLYMVTLEIMGYENQMEQLYMIIGEFAAGLEAARNGLSQNSFGCNYRQHYALGQLDKIQFIDYQLPSRLTYFRDIPAPIPPRVIE